MGASVPHLLLNQQIRDLNVDDPIWSDPALYADGGDIPQWMYDTIFKAGIQAILQLNHCSEEKEWLDYEVEAFIG